MRIKVVSDLHLEFSTLEIKNTQKYDVLILSGDIAVVSGIIAWKDFFDQVSAEFPLVIYIMGNHEFYHGKWRSSIVKLREFTEQYPNIKLLENESIVFGGVGFIGSTLWTDLPESWQHYVVKSYMNDYRQIRNDLNDYQLLTPLDTIARHKISLDYIAAEITRMQDAGIEKIVVATHHAPSKQSIPDKFKASEVNNAYYTDLDQFIIDNPVVKLWTHGHVHQFQDYTIGSTRVVCNPRGYHSERHNEETFFDENFLAEI